jgi:hypothetical protein
MSPKITRLSASPSIPVYYCAFESWLGLFLLVLAITLTQKMGRGLKWLFTMAA